MEGSASVEQQSNIPPVRSSGSFDWTIGVEKRRFHVMLILILQQIVNTTLWISFAPVAVEMSELYSVSIQCINTLSAICLLLFPVSMIMCSYVTANWGLWASMVLGSALNLLSGLLRWASYPLIEKYGGEVAYGVLLFGQIFGAFAQPIFTNTPVLIANTWFGANERDTAMTISNLGFGLGNVVGVGVPSLIVMRTPEGVKGIGKLLAAECIMCVLAFVWCILGFSEKPTNPPSRAEAQKRNKLASKEKENPDGQSLTSFGDVLAEYKTLLTDKNFCFLLISFSIVLGGFNSLFTDLEQFLKPSGYSIGFTSTLGNIFVLGGFVTSAASGIIMDKTHAYRPVLKGCFIATFFAALNFCMQLKPNNDLLLCIAGALFGLSSLPLLPVTLANAAEAMYPIPEEAATGLLILGGNMFGVLFTYIIAALLEMSPTFTTVFTPAAQFTLAIIGVAATLSMFFNGEYKRTDAENARRGGTPKNKVAPLEQPFIRTTSTTSNSFIGASPFMPVTRSKSLLVESDDEEVSY